MAESIGLVFCALAASVSAAQPAATPPTALRVHPNYPHYFQDAKGRPVLLIGDYTWGAFSDVDFDYQAMFDSLKARGLNCARVWLWWGGEQFPPPEDQPHIEPFLRPGPGHANDGRPRYDLSQWNPAFFGRLREFCAAGRRRGLFLQLITVDAWMLKHPHLWKLHAFHRDNNVNSVDGDPRNTGEGTDGQRGFCSMGNPKALEVQKAYLRKLVDTLSDFDNVLIEIANENYYSAQWERHLCEFIRELERAKRRRHLLMPLELLSHSSVVQKWDPKVIHAALLDKQRLGQPLIFDTDWIINPNDGEVRRAMWTAVLSGAHFDYMDDSLEFRAQPKPDKRAALHRQIGHLAAFMQPLRPWEMRPDGALVRAGQAFAMASAQELAVYLPAGGRVTLAMHGQTGAFTARWFNPREGTFSRKFALDGSASVELAAPDNNDWALVAKKN